MKRALALALLLSAMLSPAAALAATKDYQGPACTDLGPVPTAFYGTDSASGHAIFMIELTTHDASCPQVDYVLHEAAGQFADQVRSGDGSTTLIYVVDLGQSPNATPAGTAPTTICVFFTSEFGNARVADRSPDESIKNCVTYELDPPGSPGGEGFDQ
jgi:hypothetical protein